MKTIRNLLISIILIGALVAGSCWWLLQQDFVAPEQVPPEVEITQLRILVKSQHDTIIELDNEIWALEKGQWQSDDRLELANRLNQWLKRGHDLEKRKLVEAYEEALNELVFVNKELKLELEQLRKQLKDELRSEWSGLVDFPDMATLLIFLAEDPTDKLQYESDDFDCTEFGFQLMRNAAEKGYRLYPTVMWSFVGSHIISSHMACFAIINRYVEGIGEDQFIVAIEPSLDEVRLIGRLGDKESWAVKWYPFLP